jgi:predicted acetyltransferase
MPGTSVHPASHADRQVLERLWLMFRHDMSEFRGELPNADGTFRSERLAAAFEHPDWVAYLVTQGGRPVGFAIVRGLAGPLRVLNSFFVVRGVRRTGVGMLAVRDIVGRHPGPWEVAFQHDNPAAVAFWRRVAAQIAGGDWVQESRPVPGRPDIAPDEWICFNAR